MNRFVASLALTALASGGPGVWAATAQASPSVEAEIAIRIVDRMPEGAGSEFAADVGELFLWSRVTGGEGTTIHHVWIHGEDEYSVALEIDGSPWRTWSSKAIPAEWTGEWRVEIRDDTGNVLDALTFTVG